MDYFPDAAWRIHPCPPRSSIIYTTSFFIFRIINNSGFEKEKSHYNAMALFISLYWGTICFDSTASTTFVAFCAVIHNSFGNLVSAQSCNCCEAVECMIFRFFHFSYIAVPCVLFAFSAITYIVFCHNASS